MKNVYGKLSAGLFTALMLVMTAVPSLAVDPVDPDYAAMIAAVWTKVAAGYSAIFAGLAGILAVGIVVRLAFKWTRRVAS